MVIKEWYLIETCSVIIQPPSFWGFHWLSVSVWTPSCSLRNSPDFSVFLCHLELRLTVNTNFKKSITFKENFFLKLTYFVLEDTYCAKSLQLCWTICNPMDCGPPRLLCPWDSPGQNTGVGCWALPPEWSINNIVKFQVDSKGTCHKYTCSFFFFLLFILIFSCGAGEKSIKKNILLYPEVCFKETLLFHFMTQPKTLGFLQLSSPSRQPFHQDQFEVSMIIPFYENHFEHLKKSPSSWANSTP